MWWAHPSWNGDFRLEGREGGCVLKVFNPTPKEQAILRTLHEKARKKKWVKDSSFEVAVGHEQEWHQFAIDAPLQKVEPVLLKIVMPKKTTLSALVFKDGKVETTRGTDDEAIAKLVEKTTEPDAKAAVSVKRPTPSCPACVEGAIAPAGEVLAAFLTPAQHESWAKERRIVVTGGFSGHRYVIAHRHTPLAAKFGRIAFDIEDSGVMHFFDWSVPPEEEVLAAKLILENAEDWLRNEATCLQGTGSAWTKWTDVYKNPFGDALDGIESHEVGHFFGGVATGLEMMLRPLLK